jgi:hypothetical protein
MARRLRDRRRKRGEISFGTERAAPHGKDPLIMLATVKITDRLNDGRGIRSTPAQRNRHHGSWREVALRRRSRD